MGLLRTGVPGVSVACVITNVIWYALRMFVNDSFTHRPQVLVKPTSLTWNNCVLRDGDYAEVIKYLNY
jgi:hypothetical protein